MPLAIRVRFFLLVRIGVTLVLPIHVGVAIEAYDNVLSLFMAYTAVRNAVVGGDVDVGVLLPFCCHFYCFHVFLFPAAVKHNFVALLVSAACAAVCMFAVVPCRFRSTARLCRTNSCRR